MPSSSIYIFFNSHSVHVLLMIRLQYLSFFCSCNICFFGIGILTSCIISLGTSISMFSICSMKASCTFADSNSSKQATLNSSPGGSCVGYASGVMSNNLDKLSVRVFLTPEIQSNSILNCSSSTAQLLTLALRVFFSKNFFSGR